LTDCGKNFHTMQTSRNNAGFHAPHARLSGFTLIELMVVVAVVGVMASFAVPSYRRTIEQSRVDIAGANLRAIWAAQRLYWLENQTYTTDLGLLKNLGILDQKIPIADSATSGEQYWESYFYYTVLPGSGNIATSFTAKANASTFTGSTSNLQISQTGELSGNVSPSGTSRKIVPIDFW
jgi:prepilin-type N-terminal cleavage/methylation domain-containing protein